MRVSIRRASRPTARRRRAARSSWTAGWFACHGRPRRTCAPSPPFECACRVSDRAPRSRRARPRPVELRPMQPTTAGSMNSPGASRRPGWRSTHSCSGTPSLLRGRRLALIFCSGTPRERPASTRPTSAMTSRPATATSAPCEKVTCLSSGSSTASAGTSPTLVNTVQNLSGRGVGLRVLAGQGA